MVTTVIVASNKTQLSQFKGDQKAWPVYLTPGNICKELCCQLSAHAAVLLGYLPVSNLECFSDSEQSLAGYQMFHYCIGWILQNLKTAGCQGVEMICADGYVRKVYPILAAYIADYPEQCLVACTMENRCPICKVDPKKWGDPLTSMYRLTDETRRLLAQHKRGKDPSLFEKLGIRAIYTPFWEGLGHCEIFHCFAPDLLHQIHKGVFKDHLLKWCMSILGSAETDARFQAMTASTRLRHFKHGISGISQWTGTEHKEMEKVFMGIIAGGVG